MRGLPSPELPPRSASWPLSTTEQRYNLRRLPSRHRQPSDHAYEGSGGSSGSSSSSSSDSGFKSLDGPDEESANVGSSRGSTGSPPPGDFELDLDIILWTTGPAEITVAGPRPSTIAVPTRFLRLCGNTVLKRAVFFAVGVLLGSFLTWWCCSMATTTAPTTAEQHQRQALMGRLATDLQMLHWDAVQAFGVASPLGAAVSDEDVRACLKTVGKKYRYLAGVWHPDRCVYEKAGLLAEWQCNELYKTTTAKKDQAFYSCLGSERRLSKASQAMWRNVMEKENEGEGGHEDL